MGFHIFYTIEVRLLAHSHPSLFCLHSRKRKGKEFGTAEKSQPSKRSILKTSVSNKEIVSTYVTFHIDIYIRGYVNLASSCMLNSKNINTLEKRKKLYFSFGVYLLCEAATVKHNAQVV